MNASTSSLCPGYKQVNAFGSNDEYEDDDEEEVTYITLDLGSIEPTLVPSSSTYRLIGLDTPTPFLQLSGTILKGRHDTLLGTELLFTDGKDPNDKHNRAVNHISTTSQRICFKEVRLVPKGGTSAAATAAAMPNGKVKTTKGKMKDVEDEATAAQHEDASQVVDRVTGKNAPHPRAPRTRTRTRTPSVRSGRDVVVVVGSARRTRGSTKAKAKGKAVEEEEEGEGEGGEEGEEDGGDDDMDIYED